MARPRNIEKMLSTLTPTQLEQLRELLKEDPRIARLEKRLAELDEKRETLIAEIQSLKGGKTGKRHGQPVRTMKSNPGRPKKTVSMSSEEAIPKKRRGRPPMAKAAKTVDTPKRRGRPAKTGVSTPETRAAAAKAVAKKERTPEEQAKINARMAKARAARMQKSKVQVTDSNI